VETKTNLKNLESTSQKVIHKLTEDMERIKAEWERKYEENVNIF
jgi:hypothetical protein